MQSINQVSHTLCLLVVVALSSLCFASTKLIISPANPKQLNDSTLRFSATLNKKNVSNSVNWSSSNPAVATITSGGKAMLLSTGTTTITATLRMQKASTVLTVTTAINPVFNTQPSDANVGAVINAAGGGVRVQLLDNLGDPLPGQNITMGIGNNPPRTGTLTGTLIQTTDSTGTATFPDLKIDWLGAGYSLEATANPSSGQVVNGSAPFNEVGVGDPCLWGGTSLQTCGFITACADGDGDGLPDAWENAGGIDLKGDGTISSVLTNVDPVFPDGTPNPTPSADPNAKDVFVKYDWMELPDQLTNGQATSCTLNPLHSPYNLYLRHHSDACDFDQVCLPPSGLTASCDSATDNCTCKGHSDEPSPAALKAVIDAYSGRGIRLHIVKGRALSHANVTYLGSPPAVCTQEFSSYTFSGTQVANFYDIKNANLNASYNGQNFDEQHLLPVFHYALFAHRHTCDSVNDCNNTSCETPDLQQVSFNSTGLSWLPGQDIIVSMGGLFDETATYLPDTGQGGTFMHELGHNLGLNHGGPAYVDGVATDPNQVKLNYKPNFVSVMNYDFQTLGVSSADPNCAPDDIVCRTTAVTTRLDYSSFCSPGQITCDPNQQTVPNTLDEENGLEANGINIGNNDIGYVWSPSQTGLPATGPVDFDGNGNDTDTWCATGCTFTSIDLNNDAAGGDTLQPFEDWPNLFYQFQCSVSFLGEGASGALAVRGRRSELTTEFTTDDVLEKHLLYPPKPVHIEVLPRKSEELTISIAIMGSPDLDVTKIDLSSLNLHRAKPVSIAIEDVNYDHQPDLVVSFDTSDLKLHRGATGMRLSGWLKNSQAFWGEDKVRVLPSLATGDDSGH